MSPIKEPHYFAPNAVSTAYTRVIHDKDEYLKLFRGVNDEKAIGEASPSYLWDRESADKIHHAVPDARIIMILRNPVERAFSHYLMNVSVGTEKLSFYDSLKKDYGLKKKGWGISNLYIDLGLYADQVKRYLDTFGYDRVKILIFEEFIKQTQFAVKELFKFADIDAKVPPDNVNVAYKSSSFIPRNKASESVQKTVARCINRSNALQRINQFIPASYTDIVRQRFLLRKTSKPAIPHEAQAFLKEIYSRNVIKLSSIIERHSLPWLLISKQND